MKRRIMTAAILAFFLVACLSGAYLWMASTVNGVPIELLARPMLKTLTLTTVSNSSMQVLAAPKPILTQTSSVKGLFKPSPTPPTAVLPTLTPPPITPSPIPSPPSPMPTPMQPPTPTPTLTPEPYAPTMTPTPVPEAVVFTGVKKERSNPPVTVQVFVDRTFRPNEQANVAHLGAAFDNMAAPFRNMWNMQFNIEFIPVNLPTHESNHEYAGAIPSRMSLCTRPGHLDYYRSLAFINQNFGNDDPNAIQMIWQGGILCMTIDGRHTEPGGAALQRRGQVAVMNRSSENSLTYVPFINLVRHELTHLFDVACTQGPFMGRKPWDRSTPCLDRYGMRCVMDHRNSAAHNFGSNAEIWCTRCCDDFEPNGQWLDRKPWGMVQTCQEG